MYGKSDVGSQCTNKLCSPNGSPRGSLCLTVKRSGFINARYPSRPLGQKLEVVAGVEMTLELFRRLADLLPAPLCCGMRRSWGRAWSGWCCCREGTLGHTLPHPATPCHTLPYCATPCHTVPHPATPCHTTLSSRHPVKSQPQHCHLQRERREVSMPEEQWKCHCPSPSLPSPP